jgi:two-component system alkaline phosphatase synthesis response regulator PhoP
MDATHILLVDDDPDMHENVRLILEPQGYRVTCCSTGPAGMAAMRREPPDLVLMDVMLTNPTEGFHLVYEMRADDALKGIPIIMITAICQASGVGVGQDAGSEFLPVERFIEKPFDAATLQDAVRATLSADRSPSA